MRQETDGRKKEPYYIFTDEEADRLIIDALEGDFSDPEPLVKLLLLIHDHIKDVRLQESLYLLMKAAFKYSIVYSVNFQEYVEAIRRGRNPAEEVRAREYGSHNSEA